MKARQPHSDAKKETAILFGAYDSRKAFFLSSLFLLKGQSREQSLAEFDAFSSGNGVPTGRLHYQVDRGYTLVLNDFAETAFLRKLAGCGYALSIRGQTREIPYVKPWAETPSPYYPDFILYTHEKKIAIVEIKSILGMAQDENIVKWETLYAYAAHYGYEVSWLDAELTPFSAYLSPEERLAHPALAAFFDETVQAIGGFTNNDLRRMEERFPRFPRKTLYRVVASSILLNPRLVNRYCHDSPDLVNAVLSDTPVPYKLWR